MLKSILPILVWGILILNTYKGTAQGCSDAGFCTIAGLKHQPTDTGFHKASKISLVLPFGIGDDDVFIFSPGIQFDARLNTSWSVQAKATVNYASGNLSNTSGAGDIFLTGGYHFNNHSRWKGTITGGVKVPLGAANNSEEGFPLPMQYQPTLGTFDFIAGLTFTSERWLVAAGWQQPLTGENKNGFLPVYWNGKPEANNYPPTNKFNRKGDVLLRAGRQFNLTQRFRLTAGLLGIYHLGEDEYRDQTVSTHPISLEGSNGLTLNLTGGLFWKTGRNMAIGIAGGVPLVVRDIRPDGLTRQWVLMPEISWNF